MTTAFLEQVDVPAISARARKLTFGHFLILVITGFFYAIGWVLGSLWFGVVFCVFAAAEGFRTAGAARRTPARAYTDLG